MRRMFQLEGLLLPPGDQRVDVRVRVDFAALARVLGPKAAKARSFRIQLYDGAVTVEAFNIRSTMDSDKTEQI